MLLYYALASILSLLLLFSTFGFAVAAPLSGTWTQLPAGSSWPGEKRHAAIAYDSDHKVFVMFGGQPGTGQTWIYHTETKRWEQKFPAVSPPSRWVAQMTYDRDNHVAVLFGGLSTAHESERNDTWVYNYETNTWTEIITATKPPIRHWPGLVYDPSVKKVVLFGGHFFNAASIPDAMYNDLWFLDVDQKTWTKIEPKPGNKIPAPRQVNPIYNTNDQLIYIFGGRYELNDIPYFSDFFSDIWSYNARTNEWQVVKGNTTGSDGPSDRRTKWAFDPANNHAILFSGPLQSADTWLFDFGSKSWTRLTTGSAPAARFGTVLAFDPVNSEFIQYGGTGGNQFAFADMWALTYPSIENNLVSVELPHQNYIYLIAIVAAGIGIGVAYLKMKKKSRR